MNRIAKAFAAVATLATLASTPAGAQLFRAYLAGDGNDANPCTLPAPCRLLPAALNAVADGGQIWMLDSANYNTATVNVAKSVTVLAVPGVVGSVVAAGGPAIQVNTAGVNLTLRNLVIGPLAGAGGTRGVEVTAGTSLTLDQVLVAGLPGTGIHVSGATIVRILDSTIRDGALYGVYLENGATATISRSVVSRNASHGIYVFGDLAATTTSADVSDCVVDHHTNNTGVIAWSANATATARAAVHASRMGRNWSGTFAYSGAGGEASVSVSASLLSNNRNAGIGAQGAGAKAWASGNNVSQNSYGVYQYTGGVIETAGNNAVRNNSANTVGVITALPGI